MTTIKPSKPYILDTDRIQIKIRNPMDGKFISKSFKYSDYGGTKEGAMEASKKWSDDVQQLINEKNKLNPLPMKKRKERQPEKKLLLDIQDRKEFLGVLNPMSDPTQLQPQPIQQSQPQAQPQAQSQIKPQIEKKAFPFKTWIPEKTGASLVLMAKSKAGKTSFLHQIVKSLPKDMIKIIISPNIHTSIYDSMRNKCVYSPVFDSRIIKMAQRINQKTKNFYRFCFILDDCIDMKSNSTLLKMFLTLRNSNISAILSVQSTMLVNKLVRGNANFLLLGRLSGEESIMDTFRKFLVNYKSDLGIKSDSDVVPVYDGLTDNYRFIYVNTLKDKIYSTSKDD
jgi:hypothetical protein